MTAAFVKRFATVMITALQIRFVVIACATLDAAAITRVQMTSPASTINAEVSIKIILIATFVKTDLSFVCANRFGSKYATDPIRDLSYS